MQDKTINNALQALRKQGGTQGKLAEVILDMREVEYPAFYQDNPLTRGGTKRFILAQLHSGPKSYADMADALQVDHPNISRLVVDVHVQRIDGEPKGYTVVEIHESNQRDDEKFGAFDT